MAQIIGLGRHQGDLLFFGLRRLEIDRSWNDLNGRILLRGNRIGLRRFDQITLAGDGYGLLAHGSQVDNLEGGGLAGIVVAELGHQAHHLPTTGGRLTAQRLDGAHRDRTRREGATGQAKIWSV